MPNDTKPTPEQLRNKLISEKMQAGLTRDQAIEVIDRQADYDAELAKAANKKADK